MSEAGEETYTVPQRPTRSGRRTESTLREERDRLLADLERERERVERLEEKLKAEQQKGFWGRLFGR